MKSVPFATDMTLQLSCLLAAFLHQLLPDFCWVLAVQHNTVNCLRGLSKLWQMCDLILNSKVAMSMHKDMQMPANAIFTGISSNIAVAGSRTCMLYMFMPLFMLGCGPDLNNVQTRVCRKQIAAQHGRQSKNTCHLVLKSSGLLLAALCQTAEVLACLLQPCCPTCCTGKLANHMYCRSYQ